MSIKLLPLITFIVFSVLERFIPLQEKYFSKLKRLLVNGSMGIIGYLLSAPIALTVIIFSTNLSQEMNFGLHLLDIRPVYKFFLSFLGLDLSIYLWHRLNHKISVLWRFHNVHHIDTEMDAATAFRFHFGELILSSLFRSVVLFLCGIKLVDLVLFEVLVTSCAIFHHSNIRLPNGFEKIIQSVIISPRLHQLHHSRKLKELNSNYGTILSLWDRLFKSFTKIDYRNNPKLGIPNYNDQTKQSIRNLLILPFQDHCKD